MAKTDDVIVDETDRAIVRELLKNARKTYTEIGEIIGYTTMGAKKRVDKLLENKLITTTILTNVKEFKLHLALVFLEVRNAEKLREIFVKFEKCPSAIYVFKTLGKYNLIALISAEDEDTLESVIARNFSIRTQEGIWSSEFYPICGIFYSPFLPMRKDACQKASDKSPCGAYCVTCESFEKDKCVGCWTTKHYKGRFKNVQQAKARNQKLSKPAHSKNLLPKQFYFLEKELKMDNTDGEIIDGTDGVIGRELLKNARKTYKEIGEIIGYTTMGAKKRLDKFLKSQLIKPTILFNVKEFKLNLALVFLEIENDEKLREIFLKFEKCPNVIYVFKTLGKYNLIALLAAEDKDTLESITFEKCSIRTQEGVLRSEFYLIGKIFYSPFLPMRKGLCHKDLDKSPCDTYCVICLNFEKDKCIGCWATKHYKGRFKNVQQAKAEHQTVRR